MSTSDVLVDQFERIRDALHPAVNALSFEELAYRPGEESNSISWLVWHLTRMQDQVVSSLAEKEPVWTAHGWYDRFSLPLDPADTGAGHDAEKVGMVTSSAGPLLDYFEDVHQHTIGWLSSLDDAALSKVLDEMSYPPTTVERQLNWVIADNLQHVGQAAYVRGLVQHR